jgi:biopolymer transport protein ExbD
MAAKLNNSDDLVESHEINVTPFIDVMLVLLIIFMVAAPLSTVDVPVDLPGSNASPAPRPDKPIFLTLEANLQLKLAENPVQPGQLGQALNAASGGDNSQRIFLRADKSVAYGDLTNLMNELRTAGYLKIALVGAELNPGAPASGPHS